MLARASAGHCEDKVWSVVMGERNSGKSIIGRLLKTALGPYVTTIVPENLLVTHGRSGGADEAVKRSWMYLMQFARLTIKNEFRKLPGLKVDGNMPKQTTSGSDLVAVRKRYGHDENIKIMATLIMMCNDFPDVECTDALETLVSFAAPHKFVNEDELDPTDLCLKPKDPSISSWCDRPEVGDAMFWILVDSYRKDKVSLTQTMIDFKGIFKRKDDQEVVEELFEFTKNPIDWMASQQVEEMMQAKGINFSIMRFGNFATKRNRGMIGSLRDRSKYNGSRVWGFRGVKARVGYEARTDCN